MDLRQVIRFMMVLFCLTSMSGCVSGLGLVDAARVEAVNPGGISPAKYFELKTGPEIDLRLYERQASATNSEKIKRRKKYEEDAKPFLKALSNALNDRGVKIAKLHNRSSDYQVVISRHNHAADESLSFFNFINGVVSGATLGLVPYIVNERHVIGVEVFGRDTAGQHARRDKPLISENFVVVSRTCSAIFPLGYLCDNSGNDVAITAALYADNVTRIIENSYEISE